MCMSKETPKPARSSSASSALPMRNVSSQLPCSNRYNKQATGHWTEANLLRHYCSFTLCQLFHYNSEAGLGLWDPQKCWCFNSNHLSTPQQWVLFSHADFNTAESSPLGTNPALSILAINIHKLLYWLVQMQQSLTLLHMNHPAKQQTLLLVEAWDTWLLFYKPSVSLTLYR